jgi:hypothetical protein
MTQEELNLLKWITNSVGRVFDPQLTALKQTALFIGESPVTITLVPESKRVSYSFSGNEVPNAEERLREVTEEILGPNWGYDVFFEGAIDVKPDQKREDKPTKRRGKGSTTKVRKRK